MYGQGPYAPQYGQSPNRPPRPPFMQQQRPFSPHAVAQPVGQEQAQSSSSSTSMHPFLSAQQGAQSAQYFLPLPPQPPPSQNQNLYRQPIHQPFPDLQQITLPHSALPLPPPPPPMLPPSPPQPPESVQNIVTHDTNRGSDPNDASVEGGLSSMPSDTVDVPPPRPTNEITLRNMEILCQYISQNGPAFEDMARQKESGNSVFRFLFGGEPGSEAAAEREYYLWMKNELGSGKSKSNLLVKDKHDENGSSVEPNKEASYPVTDSDMEMEDDIMQPSEETVVHDQVSGPKQEFVSAMDDIEKNDQNNLLHTSTICTEPAMNLGGDDGGMSNQNIGTKTQIAKPFRRIKDYSSDESSEFDALEPLSPLQLHEPKDLDTAAAQKIEANEVIDKKSDIAVGNNDGADEPEQSDYNDLKERDALESSCVNLISDSGKDRREGTKSSASAKVDEFGRLIRESASESESDDSRQYRRRGRRGRSRSPSKSPPKRRRRSPWRRKERRSLSRSWSPKRRRSRSRSPLRRPIEIGSQRNSRGRHQIAECFDFLKGRCYRGASCKYLHNDPDKYSQSQQHRTEYHASQTRTTSRDYYDHSEENKVTKKESSLDEIQNDKIKDGDLKAIDGATHRVEASSSCLPNSVSHSENISDLFNSNLQKDKKPEDVQISAVSPCKKDLSTSVSSSFHYPNHVSQLQQPLHLPLPPPPPPPPSLHAASIPHIPQPMQYYSSEHQQTQFHPPQNLPWGNFPPQQPPHVRFDLLMQSFLNTKPADPPSQPQAGNLQGSYNISMQGSHQPVAGELSSSGFQNPPYLQQPPPPPPYGFYQAASLQTSADLHKNNPSQASDTGSRITAHHNPYASTFDQPLGSKFSSDVFNQGNKTSGSEYDPLFDSLEPLKQQTVEEDRAADNSDIMLRLSKVKGKKKADSAAMSSETDEFGETAHPEVIAVEGGSQSNLNDSAEGSGGDVEINQGKSKKNKDSSRSMKLFRVALASFVKDMLKPSWRQGNMSKEAFKTIVKKTVEKVSGAMKGHRVPKSKANIDQYINQSQRKLTALVEGYVNKYAK